MLSLSEKNKGQMQRSKRESRVQRFTYMRIKIGDKRGVDDETRRDDWSGEKRQIEADR